MAILLAPLAIPTHAMATIRPIPLSLGAGLTLVIKTEVGWQIMLDLIQDPIEIRIEVRDPIDPSNPELRGQTNTSQGCITGGDCYIAIFVDPTNPNGTARSSTEIAYIIAHELRHAQYEHLPLIRKEITEKTANDRKMSIDNCDAKFDREFLKDKTAVSKGRCERVLGKFIDQLVAKKPLSPPSPLPAPQPLPPLSSGDSWGDPHLRTIDGLAYDFQATGEFVLTRSTTGSPTVHARFGTNSIWGPNVSLNRGLAVRDQTDLVTFSDVAGPAFEHTPPIRVNGALVDPTTLPLALPRGGRLEAADPYYYRLTTSDGSVVEVTRDGYPAYIVTPAPALVGALEGLLGNFDGDIGNDAPDDLYGAFADRWRVPAGNSLFTTAQPASELVPAAPQPVRLSDFPAADVAAALETCRGAGVDPSTLEDCAIDLLITGNSAAAVGAAAVAGRAVGTVDHDFPPVTQQLSSLVGQPVTTVVPADGAVQVVLPVGADRAFRLDPGPGCTPSPLVAAVQVPGSSSTVSVDLGSCTDDRVLGTGPEGGQLVVTLRALGTDVPARFAVVYVPIQAGPFDNGSFEAPVIDSPFHTLQVGETIEPWTVTAGEVDLLSTWATPQEGRQSVDLSGSVGGRICQSFTTTPGSRYSVSFWMSHNAVDVSSASLLASITGITSLPFTHNAASTNTDPQWEQHVFRFTAAATSSELCFESTDPPVGSGPSGGALLDDVTVT